MGEKLNWARLMSDRAVEMKSAALEGLVHDLGGPAALGGPVVSRIIPIRSRWPEGAVDYEELIDADGVVIGWVELRIEAGEIKVTRGQRK